ncbi:hypothetical protein EYC59_04620 [Candidatus Saccharibacteria bacterium]|nr:MAG: hypothetical protein EYC59_04620 [Candidatus Saccharibacteria bacterium]
MTTSAKKTSGKSVSKARSLVSRVSNRGWMYVGIGLFAVVGSVLLMSSHAATPTVSYEVEAGTRSANASLVADSTASGTSAVKFSATAQTLYGWQLTAANTGLAAYGLNCASIPVYTGNSKPAAGTTISQKRFTGPLDLSAGNITIDKSCIQPTSVGQGLPTITTTDYNNCTNNGCAVTTGLVTISNSEIDGSLLSAYDSAFTTAFIGIATLRNNYIHDMGSGIGLMNTGKQISVVVEGNYVTRLRAYGDGGTTGNHSDGFTIRDFDASQNPARTVVVQNNRFDCNSGNDTGAFFIQTYAGNINNVTASGNLLEGGGYTMGLNQDFGNTYSNVKATNNRFAPTGYGAAYVQGGTGWSVWTDNYRNDPTKIDNKGAVVPQP